MTIQYLGNRELLKLKKTAFLSSSTIAPDMVLRCYDWAAGKHERCVVSGFSSKLERDVLHFLIKAKCPIVLVLARRMYSTLPDELKEPVEQGRMLIISTTDATRQSRATAYSRNRYICELADELLLVGVTEESSLYPLKEKYQSKLTNMTIGSRQ
jgi:predicted Rossmann fold nucleotide-binding protein DprA/Smf involved in DNA uptake